MIDFRSTRTIGFSTCLAIVLFVQLLANGEETFPSFVNWTYDGAYRENNGLRDSICLNGWWRWQLKPKADATPANDAKLKNDMPPEGGWFYRKVPGIGINFDILDGSGKSILIGKKTEDLREITNADCWVEREFTVPGEWKDRDVQLIFENSYCPVNGKDGDGEIFLDGKKMGMTWPNRAYHLDLAKPYKAGTPSAFVQQ